MKQRKRSEMQKVYLDTIMESLLPEQKVAHIELKSLFFDHKSGSDKKYTAFLESMIKTKDT